MNLTENDIKNIMYGAIRELTRSTKYYYSGYHSHFTEDGKRLITEMMDLYAEKIDKAIKAEDEQRSKDMVFNQLKGEGK
jgi:uncharacterized protein (UPF0305 family)